MDKRQIYSKIRIICILVSLSCLVTAVFMTFAIFANLNSQNEYVVETPSEVSHRVLFLSSYDPKYYTADSQLEGLEKSLYPNGIEYDVIYMDAKKYNSISDKSAFHDYFSSRMKGKRKYEAIIAGDDDALQFALDYEDEMFGELPIIFFGINDPSLFEQAQSNPRMIGLFENNYLKDTLETAMALFPDIKKIVGIHDESSAGKSDAELFYELEADYPGYSFSNIDTSYRTKTEFIHALERLPEDCMLMYMTCYSDIDGNSYSLLDRTNLIVSNTDRPVFRNYQGAEDTGIIGGTYMDFTEHARLAGDLAVSVLSGADISSIPVDMDTPSRSSYDYLMMEKFKLDPSKLPADAVLYNKPETFMEIYGYIIPPVAFIGVALLLLLVGTKMTAESAKVTNKELRESKEKIEKSEQEMKYRAEHDDLMGLLNRRAAAEHLRAELSLGDTFSVIMADIDGFKNINESYGHQITDEILITIANSLKELTYKNNWFIARYGGDEFLFMIPGRHVVVGDEISRALLELFSTPIPIGGETVAMAASLGISNSDGETSSDGHIANAESAMYVAKQRGGNGAFLFSEEMKAKQKQEEVIREKLLEAFDNDGFYMLYQPQINSITKKVSGYEALVRMKEPGIYPGQFIPVAEQNGWIWKIGRITTELVIKQLAAWRDAGYELHPVSVNFSSNQINDLGYVRLLEDLFEKYNVPAKYLEIEITEGLFLDRSSQSTNLFNRFKELGIRLLMDDFGTGYSSLGYLTYIPVDVIKLDKSLVDAYLVDGKDMFIRDVIQLMHDLDKEMIIEGVEEKWQFERLREFGAETIQGYYFSKPITAEEAIVFTVGEDK